MPRPDPVQLLNLGYARQQRGELEAAESLYRQALALAPGQPDALHLLGVIANQRGRHAEAARLIGQAVAAVPGNPMFLVNLANALEAEERPGEAEAALRQAVAAAPTFAAAHHNLGNLLVKAERYDDAISCYDRAIVADPNHVAACVALGKVLLTHKKRADLAVQLARKALASRPEDPKATDLLVDALLRLQRHKEALPVIEGLAMRQADVARNWSAMAYCLFRLNRVSEAIAAYRRAIALSAEDIGSRAELGRILCLAGDIGAGSQLLQEAIRLAPRNREAYSRWLFHLNYRDDVPTAEVLAAHRGWEELVDPGPGFVFAGARDPARRLRIAYLSPDFKRHSVSFFIESVLSAHDRACFEVHAFYLSPERDEVTERIAGLVDRFHHVADASAEEIATLIHAAEIDLVIDLAGHTSEKALATLARRPAPVQATWLGYPNTTGLSTIDYRITDARADPPGVAEAWSSERLVWLPDCFHCYRPTHPLSFDPTPPSAQGTGVVFGSFNVVAKLSDTCIAAWGRILAATPGSRLLLKTRLLGDAGVQTRLLERFARQGVDADRIEVAADQPGWDEHMLRYRGVDVALDPFPYAGATTTCEALWMGVPVVTLAGDWHVARVGVSLLEAIGRPELIAADVDAYVRLACDLAADQVRLCALHAGLRADIEGSPLMDEPRFARNLEAAYRRMWEDYCAAHH